MHASKMLKLSIFPGEFSSLNLSNKQLEICQKFNLIWKKVKTLNLWIFGEILVEIHQIQHKFVEAQNQQVIRVKTHFLKNSANSWIFVQNSTNLQIFVQNSTNSWHDRNNEKQREKPKFYFSIHSFVMCKFGRRECEAKGSILTTLGVDFVIWSLRVH